jgi:hypothetical protein
MAWEAWKIFEEMKYDLRLTDNLMMRIKDQEIWRNSTKIEAFWTWQKFDPMKHDLNGLVRR